MKEKKQMSIKEADRLSIKRQIDKKNLTISRASEERGVSERQPKRIQKRLPGKWGTGSNFTKTLSTWAD